MANGQIENIRIGVAAGRQVSLPVGGYDEIGDRMVDGDAIKAPLPTQYRDDANAQANVINLQQRPARAWTCALNRNPVQIHSRRR